MSRLAGLTLPLFSLRTHRDWGVGEIGDLPAAGRFAREAGFRMLQLLPPYELSEGETSPYGARTAFGIDPIYVSLGDVPHLDAQAIAQALGEGGEAELARLRARPSVDYRGVRTLKMRALRVAFERFRERELGPATARATEFREFCQREASWEDDLSLYVAIRDAHGGHGWQTWEQGLRDRNPAALREARERHADAILFHQWLQWTAMGQWFRARADLAKLGVSLMGDLPFVCCNESADVWAHRELFRTERSLGAPPDEFQPELGQDWGLPPYDWAALDADGLDWFRARAAHAARLYDAFRIDHVVGYFRQYVRIPGRLGYFDPFDPHAQEGRGWKMLVATIEAAKGARIIAEDLGVIPPFVRKALSDLKLAGYKVLPWEKEPIGTYREPKDFAPVSVATWSTHDTAPITAWWDDMTPAEQKGLSKLAGLEPDASGAKRELALFRLLFSAGSDLALVLAPELLGQPARINTPGTVGEANWTYRLPAPLEELESDAAVRARLGALHELARASRRA
jgi:4-alpha-glucanotransferase